MNENIVKNKRHSRDITLTQLRTNIYCGKQRALPSLANYIITQIFCRFKFPHHQKRQVRANALSYSLLFFLTCDGSLDAPVRYTKKPQIF